MSEEKNPTKETKKETKAPAKTAAKEAPKAEAPAKEAPKTAKKEDKKEGKKSHKGAIITWSIIGGIVLVGGIVAAIVIPIVLSQVDYKESYDIAKDLRSTMNDFYYDYDDCVDVVKDVDNDWYSTTTFSSYVSDCKDALKASTIESVKKLGETSGVSRDSEVKAAYDKFYGEFSKAIQSVDGDLEAKLNTYDSWHKFIYNAVDMSFYSHGASDIETYAGYAINSGNDKFKEFGEQWKTKALEVADAYKAYKDAKSGTSSLYSAFTSKRSSFNSWVDDNLPKATEVLPLSFEDNATAIDSAWDDFYSILSQKYAKDSVEETTTTDVNRILEMLK